MSKFVDRNELFSFGFIDDSNLMCGYSALPQATMHLTLLTLLTYKKN